MRLAAASPALRAARLLRDYRPCLSPVRASRVTTPRHERRIRVHTAAVSRWCRRHSGERGGCCSRRAARLRWLLACWFFNSTGSFHAPDGWARAARTCPSGVSSCRTAICGGWVRRICGNAARRHSAAWQHAASSSHRGGDGAISRRCTRIRAPARDPATGGKHRTVSQAELLVVQVRHTIVVGGGGGGGRAAAAVLLGSLRRSLS